MSLVLLNLNVKEMESIKTAQIFYINKIKKNKKNKLIDNIQYLEELSAKLDQSIKDLKLMFKNINDNKEK